MNRRRRRKGYSLLEVMVVTALFAAVSAFTMVLYTTALGDFESANMKYSMSIYARRCSGKMATILSTAASRRPNVAVAEAFYWPQNNDSDETYYCDFITASNFIKTTNDECAYAFDDGTTAQVGYTPLFRYRLAWTPVAVGNVPAKSVYLERLQLNPALPTVLSGAGAFRQVLSPNISRCTFRRTAAGTMQVRLLVYAFDPDTGRSLDGQTMRLMTKRRRRDATSNSGDEKNAVKSFELLTSIPLPTLNIK
ncbi:MAG: prepilin-type N-terminal cleavage/methylation domain-containing protein [Candidatus Eremiobacteraeota bacterium]|nr:prepilin-type N-terminal cleavage/methylation domain-containing protein [Candidatus Eremiobacteraeota bacterium]MCW5868970.1 prepilin-type N-terminal cleavage/methylation domain-containing protein [Candidatus Eremiobacteraeota bacterium]